MRTICLLSFVLLLWSACDSPPGEGDRKAKPDTASVPKSITMQDSALKESVFEQQEFQNFLKEYKNKPLTYLHDTFEDVTGEGMKERVHCDIVSLRDTFVIHHQIWREKTLLFSDTVKLDPGYCLYAMWGADTSIILKYKPWSFFYSAMQYKRFILPYEKIEFSDFLANHPEMVPADTLYWKKELKKYKGKVMQKGLTDEDNYIWDKRCGQFVIYFGP
ncbi:MAG: hypothetical protein ACHQRM_03515 [Bacteroidia bacterium]